MLICCDGGDSLIERGMRHKPVLKSRWPVRMVLPWLVIMNNVWSKVAWKPASHSWPIDINDLCMRPGSRWAWLPFVGTCGKFSSQATLVD